MAQRLLLKKSALLLLCAVPLGLLFLWLPAVALATPLAPNAAITTQETPAADATVTVLQKVQLVEQVQQLQNQNNWLWTFGSSVVSTLAVAIAGLFGIFRYLRDQRAEREKQHEVERQRLTDRQDERNKQAEERFQKVVEGLGSESEAARVGASIMLRTFLRPGYEHIYSQAFDLAVAHLRLRSTTPHTPDPLSSLSQALILVFREAFPLIHYQSLQSSPFLDAARIQLDNAYLNKATLHKVWMPEAHLRQAALKRADLSKANLYKADLTGADLRCVNLARANLNKALLSFARMGDADLSQADLRGATFEGADLSGASFENADLRFASFENTRLEDAHSLRGARFYKTRGLSPEQLQICRKMGAIFEERYTTNQVSTQTSVPATSLVHQIPSQPDTSTTTTAHQELVPTDTSAAVATPAPDSKLSAQPVTPLPRTQQATEHVESSNGSSAS